MDSFRVGIKQHTYALDERRDKLNKIIDDATIGKYLSLSETGVRALRESALKNHGHVSFSVHHRFVQTQKLDAYFPDPNFAFRHLYTYVRLLSKRPHMSPMFVFEEGAHSLRTKIRLALKTYRLKNENVIFLDTFSGTGLPVLAEKTGSGSQSDREKHLNILSNILYSLGVKSIVFSGMYIDACIADLRIPLEQRGFASRFSKNALGRGDGPPQRRNQKNRLHLSARFIKNHPQEDSPVCLNQL